MNSRAANANFSRNCNSCTCFGLLGTWPEVHLTVGISADYGAKLMIAVERLHVPSNGH